MYRRGGVDCNIDNRNGNGNGNGVNVMDCLVARCDLFADSQ
jgi:hypothetical protein